MCYETGLIFYASTCRRAGGLSALNNKECKDALLVTRTYTKDHKRREILVSSGAKCLLIFQAKHMDPDRFNSDLPLMFEFTS